MKTIAQTLNYTNFMASNDTNQLINQPGVSILQRGRLPLVSSSLHPNGVVVAVDVDNVEVRDGGIALSLPTLRLHFLQVGPL